MKNWISKQTPFSSNQVNVSIMTPSWKGMKKEEQEGLGGAPSGLEKTRVAIVLLKHKYHPLFFFFIHKRMKYYCWMNN